MIADFVRHLCISESSTIAEAFWVNMNVGYKALIVVDDHEKYIGVISNSDFMSHKYLCASTKLTEIVNRNALFISADDKTYEVARKLFAEQNIGNLPVITENRDVVDYFTRERAFYRQYYRNGQLDRMNYAVSIMTAAYDAKRINYPGISVIEFGVGGGVGLLAAQFHAREISRLLGIDIKVYGFDLGTGLPEGDKGKEADNISHLFLPGFFVMNEKKLVERLREETFLILGDIKDTIADFIERHNPYPIGAIFVDVDTYQSTKYILDWMKSHPRDKAFMPRVYMYFDDIFAQYEGMGEEKAIAQFNFDGDGMIIAPEKISDDIGIYKTLGEYSSWLDKTDSWEKRRLKICHRTYDSMYNFQLGLKPESIASSVCIENSVF